MAAVGGNPLQVCNGQKLSSAIFLPPGEDSQTFLFLLALSFFGKQLYLCVLERMQILAINLDGRIA